MTLAVRLDVLRTAFFGIATRRIVVDYLRLLLLMQFILLAVAWTIDLAEHFPAIRRDADAQDIPLRQILVPYLAYRSADMVVRILPMACFFGVFLAEILRRARLETVILYSAGASPLRTVAAVAIFGALTGAAQFALESYGRPTAIEAQVDLGHGSYAGRFAERWVNNHPWFVSGDTAIRAQILRSDQPEMRDVLVFTGLRPPALRQVYAADRALPTDILGEWQLFGTTVWDIAAGSEENVALGTITLQLDLISEQLQYYGVPKFYLRNEPLRAIATMRNDERSAADADVAIWRRYTAWALPAVVALLAVSLTRSGYSGRRPNYLKLIALALAGYIAIISIKVMWSVGELGGLPGFLAAGLPIAYLFTASAWLLRRQL